MSDPAVGVVCAVEGAVARITLNRPKTHNSQTPATWEAFAELGRSLPNSVRVAVISGEGPSFSSGLDRALFTPEGLDGISLLKLAASDPSNAHAFISKAQEGFSWLSERDVMTIASVRGHAIGAGFQLALSCDVVIASETASFAMREIAYGIVPDLGGTHPLVRKVGAGRALELCATGRSVTADEAYALGIATTVVNDANLETAVEALVSQVLTAPEVTLRELVGLLRGAQDRTKHEQLHAERDAQLRVFASTRGDR